MTEGFTFKENPSFQKRLTEKAGRTGISLSHYQAEQFDRFYQMMVERNKVMNLTAITEEDEVIDKHFIDSLSCAGLIDLNSVRTVIDVGTGAGFPGIPLKIAFPHLEMVLLDSLKKRINFLREATEALGLKKVDAVHGRAEDLARDGRYRGRFDLCVSRAVANLRTLTEYCIPFVKVNGCFISYKAQKGREELEESGKCMDILGCSLEEIREFHLEGDQGERLLLRIRKDKKTPKAFPRKAGTPSREPL